MSTESRGIESVSEKTTASEHSEQGMTHDAHVVAVASSPSHVSVTYAQKARLFGFISDLSTSSETNTSAAAAIQ